MRFPRGLSGRVHKYLALRRSYSVALTAAAEETGTPIIDIISLFSDAESRRQFTDTIHFTTQGAERIAAYVARRIVGQNRPAATTATSR